MDFTDALQEKLVCSFKETLVSEHIMLIEQIDRNLSILYYSQGAERKTISRTPGSLMIHLDDDLWKTKPRILLNRIAALAGNAKRTYARQTVLARIDKKTALEFQQEHHLQGALPGKYRYGLFKQGELLAVAIFSGLRNMRHTANYRSIELLHFCHKGQHLVIGGLNKLISGMQAEFSPQDVMTYVDRDWSDGKKFEPLGFEVTGMTKPQLFRIDKRTYERNRIKESQKVKIETNEYLVENLGSIKMLKNLDKMG